MSTAFRNAALLPFLFSLSLYGCTGLSAVPQGPQDELSLTEALAAIDAQSAPEGVAEADFASLRTAMRDQLVGSGQLKWVSGAPSDAQNQVNDLTLSKIDETSADASWTYRNVGDYDQNRQVNISDLTPLGANLGTSSSDAGWPAAQIADGDTNGEVNISDITPLGAHLQNSVDGYFIQSSVTPIEESSWFTVSVALFEDSTEPPAGGARSFTATVFATSGQHFRVVPFSGQASGIAGLPVEYTGQAGGGLSFAEREITLNLIAEKMDNLTATSSALQDIEIADYIATLPHIEEAGFFDGNAWGRFDDGRLAIVCKNHAPAGSQTSALSFDNAPAERSASGYSVPKSNDFYLLWGYGEGTSYTNPTSQLGDILIGAGYNATSARADLPTLTNMLPTGNLYIDSPAGSGIARDGTTQYWIGMDEPCSAQSEENSDLSLQLEIGLAAYMFAKDGSGSGRWQYCFGNKFVELYMFFEANSFVFLNTPLSGAGMDVISAFHNVGASVVMAWTANVPNDVSHAGAVHLIDRMLGANTLGRTEDPPIRPFSLQDTLFDMQDRGVSAGQPIIYPLAPASPYDSLVRFYNLAHPFDACDLFRPSIQNMVVNIADDGIGNVLQIFGDFGDDPANEPQVVLNSLQGLDIISFDDGSIDCVLPDSGGVSNGDVAVMLNGFFSPPRQLTEWRCTLLLTSVGPGSLTHEVTYHLHIRADVNDHRNLPDSNPLQLGVFESIVPLISAPDSYATVNSYGTYTAPGGATTTWTNAGNTHSPNIYMGSIEPHMYMAGNIDMGTRQFSLFMPCLGEYHEKVVNQDLSIDHDTDELFPAEVAASMGTQLLPMTLTDSYAIEAGNMEHFTEEITWTLVWEAASPLYPPDPATPR